MNISLTLNQEQSDALSAWVAERNSLGLNLTEEAHLVEIVTSAINGKVSEYYDLAIKRLGEAAKQLPYDARLAIIQEVESAITP